jgi:uncharacterized protein YhfF
MTGFVQYEFDGVYANRIVCSLSNNPGTMACHVILDSTQTASCKIKITKTAIVLIEEEAAALADLI